MSRATARGSSPQLVLAFDTSSEHVALAVGTLDGGLVAVDDHKAFREANTHLVPSIEKLFANNGLSKRDVACVVCGRGPGSFTGVRIAVATAKGIAYALGVPLYGVSSLDAIAWAAWNADKRGRLGIMADAMRGEVYPASYMVDNKGPRRLDQHTVMPGAEAAKILVGDGRPVLLTGDSLYKYAQTLVDSVPENIASIAVLDEELWVPTGRGLLLAFGALQRADALGDGDPAALLPLYTRLSDAEENERKRLANEGAIAQGALVEVPSSGVADPDQASKLTYRPMGAADLDAVAALESNLFASASSTAGERWTRAMFAGELDHVNRSWWVAWEGNELAGFAGGLVADGAMQVLDVAVAPEQRRRGVARNLIRRLAYDAEMLGAVELSLEARASNEAALALYYSLGFEDKGLRRGYYAPLVPDGKREDARVLAVSVSSFAQAGAAGGPSGLSGPAGPASPTGPTGTAATRPRILAIETSCDETAAAVIDGAGHVLSNITASQVDFHARFGGVVPEIASRKHTENIVSVVEAALADAARASGRPAGSGLADIDAVAVTYAPGLIGALVVGVAFAKGLSWATGLPFIRVNHLEGHVYSNRLATPSLKPPFIVALLSGGTTMLVEVRAWGRYRILGQTLDDAAGEAFDKVAKALGLGYPGGPVISRLAASGRRDAIDFPRALINSKDYRFSLSGLKTAVVTYIRQELEAGRALDLPDIAASFEAAVVDVQVAKALAALEETGIRTFCLGGGVAANKSLRDAYRSAMEPRGIELITPSVTDCTDNAAMIAAVALDRYFAGRFASLADDALANTSLEDAY
ncbi:MAG: tRNA (adenosine(37)-N6)-threonylcarbamoyltransferase complex transferase subunit TsaD [Coriobacteriales bacterium]|nr:tRNA (adenosine(37)-N6)-threonylcarbamoyltransferase complex transferase subunit TsaD [Coriobacteriales bacterium]